MFVENYSLMVDKPIKDTIDIFKVNLDDMSKKGYSLSGNTVIYNSDHRLKLFTGECKNDVWVVRPADSSDIMYRFQPKMYITFTPRGNQTEINVEVKHTRHFIMFIICLVFVITVLPIAVLEFINSGDWQMFLFPIAPAIIMIISCVISKSQLNNGKVSLQYIYKENS